MIIQRKYNIYIQYVSKPRIIKVDVEVTCDTFRTSIYVSLLILRSKLIHPPSCCYISRATHYFISCLLISSVVNPQSNLLHISLFEIFIRNDLIYKINHRATVLVCLRDEMKKQLCVYRKHCFRRGAESRRRCDKSFRGCFRKFSRILFVSSGKSTPCVFIYLELQPNLCSGGSFMLKGRRPLLYPQLSARLKYMGNPCKTEI